jgi:hypothetical protein
VHKFGQLRFLGRGERPFLVLRGQFVHPLPVGLIQGQAEEKLGSRRRQVTILRPQQLLPKGGFAGGRRRLKGSVCGRENCLLSLEQ